MSDKLIMERTASDNEYFHRDFHGTMAIGITYLREKYGEEAVREYLRLFTHHYYAPLRADVCKRGLVALKDHFEKLYAIEGGDPEITFTGDELTVSILACPAVTHLKKIGIPVDPLFYETTKTINETLCEGSNFKAEYIETHPESGGCIQKFTRKEKSI